MQIMSMLLSMKRELIRSSLSKRLGYYKTRVNYLKIKLLKQGAPQNMETNKLVSVYSDW